ncbi:Uncharacterised protein [Mycoplasmopsis maculosa]|uniref:Uncharacterized protein n=1 Tax=Mycoplasmopsis maculosa TaxID=114885 RepID=A0A449B4V3_9BACT|nr:hypothetical protein [Mycoplasmopsis maculosa]VEU75599.1 Uncharacterised protein [Mycoplasmopsis maculosa]
MELLKNLAKIFEISEEDLKNKLNLSDDFDSKQLAQKLGFYALFTDKNEIEQFIKGKVKNKIEIIEELNQKINLSENEKTKLTEQINSLNQSYSIQSQKIKDFFSQKLKDLNYKNINLENLDVDSIDILNINDSIKKYAHDNNLEQEIIKPSKIIANEIKTFENVERLSFGSRKI